jgi:phosphoglucosamine mutase
MVSASHNPAEDNGLKVLDADGLKLDDAVEEDLEALSIRADELPLVAPRGSGARSTRRAPGRYVEHRSSLAPSIDRRRAAGPLDTANGQPRRWPRRSSRRPARRSRSSTTPGRGQHQRGCGRDHPGTSAAVVAERGADVGFALDGMPTGAWRSMRRASRRRRPAPRHAWRSSGWPGARCPAGLVVIVLSNGGLAQAVEAAGGAWSGPPSGDKYILEGMQVPGAASVARSAGT